MKDKELKVLVDKYLRGECLPDEELLLKKFLESYQTGENSWPEEAGDKNFLEEKIFYEIDRKIDNKIDSKLYRLVRSQRFIKIAASIMFLFVLGGTALYLSNLLKEKEMNITWIEKHTSNGEKLIITLADNSQITLNGASTIKYPVPFNDIVREVSLEGEAYFEITPDASHPFIVKSGNLSTKVLGTKFNVSAFKSEKEISVSLVEGKVQISKEKNDSEEKLVILAPHQQLVYDSDEEVSVVKDFNYQKEVGWKDNIFVFDNDPLSKVLAELERAYNVKFELADKSIGNKKVKANFKNESLWTVVTVISKATGLRTRSIKQNNQTTKIIFYK